MVLDPDGPPNIVTVDGDSDELLGGRVITLVPPAGTVTTLLPPGSVDVAPDGPPVTVITEAGLLGGRITTESLPAGMVITLPPGRVVVTPAGPPLMVVTLGCGGLLAGIVTTLLPPGGIVMTLEPPCSVVIKPDGPPQSVVVIMAAFEHGQAELEVVVELGPSISVTTLPFGRVVTTPVPQI